MSVNHEGFWKNDENPDYPFPLETDIPNSSIFIKKLKLLMNNKDSEKTRTIGDFEVSVIHYRGFSPCRLCNLQTNGSREYTFIKNKTKFVVPEGYLHYLITHNVHPSEEFVKFIES